MAPRAAGRLGGLGGAATGGGAGGRLGGLNETLSTRPLGTPLGNVGTAGTVSVPAAKKSNTKVRFSKGTKKE